MTIFMKVIWPAGYGYKFDILPTALWTRLILDSVARFTDQEYFHVNEGLVS